MSEGLIQVLLPAAESCSGLINVGFKTEIAKDYSMKNLFFGLVCLSVFVFGCSNRDPIDKSAKVEDLDKKTNLTPATKEQAEKFVELVNQYVADEDQLKLRNLLAVQKLIDRSVYGFGFSKTERMSFRSGFDSTGGMNRVFQEIIETVRAGGRFDYVRIVEADKTLQPLFRLELADEGGINYFQFLLDGDSPTGSPRAVDIFVYLTGEQMSQTIRRGILPIIAKKNKTVFNSLSKVESDYIDHLPQIQKMTQDLRSRKFESVLRQYKRLPKSIRNDKNMLLLRSTAAQEVSEKEYIEAMKDFDAIYPNDTSSAFRKIDLYALQNEFDKMLECITTLQEQTGDNYLRYLSATGMLRLDRAADAQKEIDMIIDDYSDHEGVVSIALEVALARKDWTKSTEYLDKLFEEFDLDFSMGLADVDGGSEYLKSDEYKAWRRSH